MPGNGPDPARGTVPGSPGCTPYPPELRAVLGARYCTTCVVIRPGWSADGHAVLLQADAPLTAAVVGRLLAREGFQVAAVRRYGSHRKEWIAEVTGEMPAYGTYRYLGAVGTGYDDIRNVIRYGRGEFGQYVGYDRRTDRWDALPMLGTILDEDYSGAKFVELTRPQAEGFARVLGWTLPSDRELDEVVAAAKRRARAATARMDRFYAERAERFAGQAARLQGEAERLTARPPHPERVSLVADRDRLAQAHDAVPVRLGEPFPLVRFMIGDFAPALPYPRTPRLHHFHCNRVALTTPEGETVVLTLSVLLGTRWLVDRFTVTPFAPEVGYQVDEDDFDLDARTAKLARLRHLPVGRRPTYRMLPGSPASFHVSADAPAGTDGSLLRRLALAFAFPGGRRYVTLSGWDGGRTLYFTDFVPYGRGPLASSDVLSPALAIFVPDDPHLLKTVRASFVPAPDPRVRFRGGPRSGPPVLGTAARPAEAPGPDDGFGRDGIGDRRPEGDVPGRPPRSPRDRGDPDDTR